MVLGPEVLDLLNQLLLRMLDMDLVDAFRCFYSGRTSLAWLLPITLQIVSLEATIWRCECAAVKSQSAPLASGDARTSTNLYSSLLAIKTRITCYGFGNSSTFG